VSESRSIDFERAIPASGIIEPYLRWVRKTTHAPGWFHLGSILPTIAYEAARRGYTIMPGKRPVRALVGLVGTSGCGKSTATSRAKHFTRDFFAARGLGNVKPYVSLIGSMAGVVEVLAEKRIEQLGITPAILEIDEYTQALAYSEFADMVNLLYDGEDFVRNLRRLQDAEKNGITANATIVQPRLQGLFASTPAALERVVQPHQLEGGLFSRVLWIRAKPARLAFRGDDDTHDELRNAVLSYWVQWVRHLDVLGMRVEPHERVITVSDAALDAIEARIWPRYESGALAEGRMGSFYLRLVEHARLVCALYAFSRGVLVADAADAHAATTLIEQAEVSIEGLAARLAVREHYKDVQAILEAIEAAGEEGVRRRDLYRRFGINSAVLDQVLATLSEDIVQLRPTVNGKSTAMIWAAKHDPRAVPDLKKLS
jgi:hypothetical protein